MISNSLPISFRATEVDRILSILQSGDSCSILGIGSVGKSNLLRFLQNEEMRKAKLGRDWNSYLFVYIDSNKLLQLSAWSLFELMLHQLLAELSRKEIDEEIFKSVDNLYNRATEIETQYLALRYLDRAISIICGRLGLRLVFLFDEFDQLCQSLPSQTFSALRALRDDNKYFLMYVVATRIDLQRLSESIIEIEAFDELVTPQTVWLMAYSDDDARLMLNRLTKRNQGQAMSETDIHKILTKTGGHPGLIRTAINVIYKRAANLNDLNVTNNQVKDECQRIWHSLLRDEQICLTNLVSDEKQGTAPPEMIERLRLKGLLGGTWAKPNKIFSTLFAEYISRENPAVGAHIYLDLQKHIVYVDGKAIENLAPLEYKLLEFLDRRRQQIVTRDEIIAHLYPGAKAALGISDNRIDSIVKRLRKAVEPDANEPRYLLTMRGHGLKLADGIAPELHVISK